MAYCLILNTSLPVALALDAGDMGVNSGSITLSGRDGVVLSANSRVVTAGSGGANIGNIQTGDALSSPGYIRGVTTDGGDVTTGNLLITDGLGRAEISVYASGNLTTNGVDSRGDIG
ncbi:MAG: hypothetical protein JSW47_10545 [Phycisphaerales bacterium]|nr:MAG: hypothetical protein JSW47_10545 [Phycisphaerales bacterium]